MEELDDAMKAFTAAAEREVLRLLRAWGKIETDVSPRMRRVIEAALLMATVEGLLDKENDNDESAACLPGRSANDHPARD